MKKTIYAAVLATTAMVAASSASAEDSPFTYSYIEGAFAHDNLNANGVAITDRDGIGNTQDDNFANLFDHTGNGYAARLSFNLPFGDDKVGFHFVTDYMRTNHKPGINIRNVAGMSATGFVNAAQMELRTAFGMHILLGERASLFTEFGLVKNVIGLGNAELVIDGGGNVEAEFGLANGKRTALDGRFGVRAKLGSKFEMMGYVRYHGNGKIVTGDDGALDFASKIKPGAGVYYHMSKRFVVGADYEFDTPGGLRLVARINF